MDALKISIGGRIARLRKEAGLTQRDICDIINISKNLIIILF